MRDQQAIDKLPQALQDACTKASRLVSCFLAVLSPDVPDLQNYNIWREVCNAHQHETRDGDPWARELLVVAREKLQLTQLERERIEKAGSELAGGEEIMDISGKAGQLTGDALNSEKGHGVDHKHCAIIAKAATDIPRGHGVDNRGAHLQSSQ